MAPVHMTAIKGGRVAGFKEFLQKNEATVTSPVWSRKVGQSPTITGSAPKSVAPMPQELDTPRRPATSDVYTRAMRSDKPTNPAKYNQAEIPEDLKAHIEHLGRQGYQPMGIGLKLADLGHNVPTHRIADYLKALGIRSPGRPEAEDDETDAQRWLQKQRPWDKPVLPDPGDDALEHPAVTQEKYKRNKAWPPPF